LGRGDLLAGDIYQTVSIKEPYGIIDEEWKDSESNSYHMFEKLRKHLGEKQGLSIGLNPWLDDLLLKHGEHYCNLKKQGKFRPIIIVAKDWYPLRDTFKKVLDKNKIIYQLEHPINDSINNDPVYAGRLKEYGLKDFKDTPVIFLNAIPFLRNGKYTTGNKNVPVSNEFYKLCFNDYLKPIFTHLCPKTIITWGDEAAQIVSIDRIKKTFLE
jgi:hypothetical protein